MTPPPPSASHDLPASPAEQTAPRFSAEKDVVLTWWSQLSTVRRQQLMDLHPSDPLPLWAATELWRVGVNCPLTLLSEGGRVVRKSLVPDVLAQLLTDELPTSASSVLDTAAQSPTDPRSVAAVRIAGVPPQHVEVELTATATVDLA